MKVGVVVLHYRFWPGVRPCLERVLAQTRRPESVVVVDNHSGDGSVERLRVAFSDIEVVEAHVNGGYAAGMNMGMERLLASGMDALLLLTHECLLEPDAVERLVERLEVEPDVGAVGPLLGYVSGPELVYSAGGVIDRRSWTERHLRAPARVQEWSGRPPHPVEWLDGAAIMLRSDVVRDAGFLDESYFLYFEENDYLARLRRKGWRVECVPAALAYQEPGGKPTWLYVRNRLRFVARTAPRRLVVREVARVAFQAARNGARLRSPEARSEGRDQLRGLAAFLTRRWGPPSPRRETA